MPRPPCAAFPRNGKPLLRTSAKFPDKWVSAPTASAGANIEYLTGVEVSTFAGMPDNFTVVSLPAAKYAVFPHRAHVSKLYETCDAISRWLPDSGHQSAADAETPAFFERYSEEFDPQTGMGGMEVWVPLKS